MWSLHCVGDSVQVQPGCDDLERGISGGQLHALVLPPVQAQAGEFCIRTSPIHILTVALHSGNTSVSPNWNNGPGCWGLCVHLCSG